MMDSATEEYILAHIDPEPDHLHRLNRDTHRRCLYPDMCSGHLQGRMLKMFMSMIRPLRVLELGTFTGYSALCLAEGAPEGSQIHTVEINDEMADFIRGRFEDAGYGDRITLHIGDAAEVVPELSASVGEPWDLVFIDANKRHYCDYYAMVKPLVRNGGYIIADNTLWYGKVSDSGIHDQQTLGILRFNDMVAADSDVEKVILPLRDGLTIIRKL